MVCRVYREVGGAGSLSSTCFHKIIACGALRLCDEPSKRGATGETGLRTTRKGQDLGDFCLFSLEGL